MTAMGWLNRNLKLVLSIGAIVTGAVLISGCESEESNDLAKAQQCLDRVPSSNFAAAEACMSYVSKYDSQQANILKCSIKFVAGGLTTSKIANAYKRIAQDAYNSTSSTEAALIVSLALTPLSNATDAQAYCTRTGLKGLIYLSNLAVIGSTLASAAATAGNLGGFDPNDPSSALSDTDLDAIVTTCTNYASPGAGCDYASIGSAVDALSDSYCAGANADAEVCTKINDAVAGSGGDPEVVSKQLLCLLDGKTFDGGTPGSCI